MTGPALAGLTMFSADLTAAFIVSLTAGLLAVIYVLVCNLISARRLRRQMERMQVCSEQRAWSMMAHPELLGQQAGQLNGADSQLLIDLQCLAHRLGCRLELGEVAREGRARSTGGIFFTADGRSTIALSPRLTPEMQVAVLAHEIGHAMLHGTRLWTGDKRKAESEAELFAAAMLRAYGHPVGRQAAYLKRINGDGDEWYADAAIGTIGAVRLALGYLDWLNPRH